MKIKNARILITGGSSGLGKAMARQLKDKGAQIVITGRDEDKLRSVAEELGVESIATNVKYEADVKKTYHFCDEKMGGIDVLINNAGIGTDRLKIDEMDIEKMKEVFEVNVFGATRMAKEAAIRFKKQEKGNIVNIASTASQNAYEGGSIYGTSKFALRGLSLTWQKELRPYNVRVFNINPSFVPTAFNQENREERDNEEGKLTADEIAHAVVAALAMDDRGYIPELSVHATNPF